MKIFIFTLFLIGNTSLALADNCLSFVGHYQLSQDVCLSGWPGKMQEDFVYNGVRIDFSPTSNALQIVMNPDSHHPFQPENYIADSQEHTGDGPNTGASYIVSCSSDKIVTTRIGLLKSPLITTYQINGNELSFVQSIQDDTFTRTCRFILAQ